MPELELILKFAALGLTLLSVVLIPVVRYISTVAKRGDRTSDRLDATTKIVDELNQDFKKFQDACHVHLIATGKLEEKIDYLIKEYGNNRALLEKLQSTIYTFMLQSKKGE